jgi:hypothetical protein
MTNRTVQLGLDAWLLGTPVSAVGGHYQALAYRWWMGTIVRGESLEESIGWGPVTVRDSQEQDSRSDIFYCEDK